MNNLRYNVSRAQFLYHFQIFGTKMFVKASLIQKKVFYFWIELVRLKIWKCAQIYKEKKYIFSKFFMIFGTQ